MPESNVVDKQQAEVIAAQAMHESKPETVFVVLSGQTLVRDFGWVVFFTTRKYRETHDPGDLVPGPGPTVVLRRSGTATSLPPCVPPLVAVERFEAQWRVRSEK